MAILKSAHALGTKATPVPTGSELVVCRATYTITADMGTSDAIQMMDLPANCIPVDIVLDFDALGAGTVSVGIADSNGTAVDTSASGGAAWATGVAVTSAGSSRGDAGGLKAMSRVTASATANRPVIVDVVTDTSATSGVVGLTLMYRAA